MQRETMRRPPDASNRVSVFDELETYLRSDIDGRNLETEVIRQPALFYKAALLLAEAAANRDQLKVRLENREAEADASIRNGAPASLKLTVAEMESRVRLDPTVRALRDEHTAAMAWHGKMAALKEGFSSRGWSIRDAVELQNRAQSQIDIEAQRAEANRQRRDYNLQNERAMR